MDDFEANEKAVANEETLWYCLNSYYSQFVCVFVYN